MKQLILDEKEVTVLLDYLMQKPFKESASLIMMIQSKLVEIPENKMATPIEKE